ncbi:thioredoxin reductase [Candidatus Saccharibacteria bacterium QS_5_54_17]|nr:MAG: thioredoxin reductase [Candidatus Saccharibacteria bacterium QS_5_54_17]
MLEVTDGDYLIPTIDTGETVLKNPDTSQLKQALHTSDEDVLAYHDAVMIGAGPTSLAAAIYTTREDIDTLLLERGVVGGLAAITDMIDNYPGFEEGVPGLELSQSLKKQAERFGAVIEPTDVTEIRNEGRYKKIVTAGGTYAAKTILIATGNDYKQLDIPGEKEFYGRGVHSCATCDGAFYRDKRLVVVGGGNSAAQEGMFLTKFASHIDMLVRGDHLKATEVLNQKIKATEAIDIHFNTTTDEIVGEDDSIVAVRGTDKTTGEQVEFPTDGVFVFIGLRPNTSFLANSDVELDDYGFVATDKTLETSMSGVFCAGDVRSGATQQIASAVGEGATAALMMREYLEEIG